MDLEISPKVVTYFIAVPMKQEKSSLQDDRRDHGLQRDSGNFPKFLLFNLATPQQNFSSELYLPYIHQKIAI